jgi:hypothetical protein
VLVLASTRVAAQDRKLACIASSDRAQVLRREGKLLDARRELLACAESSCPGLVQKECSQWMTEVMAQLPSVVFGARDAAGRDLLDVRVTVDGVKVADRLDGRATEMDPGAHALRFERSGAPPVDEQVLIREGEKNRIVTVTVGEPAPPPPAPRPEAPKAAAAPVPAATWIFGGLGVALLGGAIAVDLSAFDEAGCKPHCSRAHVDSIKVKSYLAGGLGIAGALSLGAAAYFFFARPAARPRSAVSTPFDWRF